MSILNISFNNNTNHMYCCTNNGYVIYALQPSINKRFPGKRDGGVGIFKTLKSTNICVLVGGGDNPYRSKDNVEIWDDKEKREILVIDLKSPVLNAMLYHEHVIVVLDKKICIFDVKGQLFEHKTTFNNPYGLCVMSVDDEKPIIATLGSRKGEVAIWKAHQESYRTFKPHQNAIIAIAINRDGSLVATASESGTLIQVYSTNNCEHKFELRRGTDTNQIYDIAFSWDSKYLACCSANSGTIHIFDLTKEDEENKNTRSMLLGTAKWLPELLGSSYFTSMWSFRQHYTYSESRMTCQFDENGALHVGTYDGKYYKITGTEYDSIIELDLQVNSK